MVPSSESESEESEAESDLESKATDSEAPNDETTTKADENQTTDTSGRRNRGVSCEARGADSNVKQGQTSGHLSQMSIDKFVTPGRESLEKQANLNRSPPTPPEELHDKLINAKKSKKKHQKTN